MTGPGLVLVAHNSRDDALAALASARRAGFADIVVADAGSTDGTAAAIEAEDADVAVLPLPNLGYGGSANQAAATLPNDVIVVANADVTFGANAARAFADAFADVDVGVVGPRVSHPDGTRQHSARTEPAPMVAVLHALLGLWWPANPWTRRYRGVDLPDDEARDVDWVSGCCLAVRRSVFDAIGGFDPAFFLFMEDVDLCHRVRLAGHRVVYAPDIDVLHRVGGALDRNRPAARRAHARSMVRWVRRRHGRLAALAVGIGARGWLVSAWFWDRTLGRRHPSTGERARRHG